MLKSFVKTALAAAVTIGAFATSASAEDASVKDMSFSITVPYKSDITVTSSDGERWDTILPQTVPLWVDIEVDTRHPGYVDRAGLFLGTCSKTGCGSNPRLLLWRMNRRDWSYHNDFSFDTGRIPVTTTAGIATTNVGDAIVNACNATLQGDEAATEVISLGVPVTATLSVNTRERVLAAFDSWSPEPITDPWTPPFNGGDVSKTTTFLMKVNCLPLSKAEAPPKPASVDMRVAEKGNTCPKDAEVTAYIDYEKPMTGRFQVVHNGAPGETIEIKAREVSLAGKTWYRIERLERYALDPGKHDFQIKVIGGGESPTRSLEVDCPPFKVTSAWLKYEVEDKDTCPKQVVEEATFHANGPGDAPYRIKTRGGLVVTQGTAHIAREGDDYVARRTRTLTIGAFDQMMQLELVNDPSAGDQKPLKVECVEALSGELTLQSPGSNSCKGEALVAIHTDGAGELPYELECGPGKSWQRKVTAMANKIGVDKVQFDVTNNEQVTCALRTRIGGKLKPLDGASMNFTCHKPIDTGADDLAPETRPEDPPPVGDTLTGDFSFVDTGGTKCPRQGKALINFKTSKPDNVHYSLDCTNGHFSGVAPTAPSPQGGFIAPALVSFAIGQSTTAKCALKTVAPGKPKVHTLKGHTFQCVRTTGVDGSDDLAPDTRPDPQAPGKPDKVVIDPPRDPSEPTKPEPKIACAGGTVKDGACMCERTMKPVKAGKNAWRCVKVAVDPKPDKPTVSQPKIACAGGTVRNGACVCGRGEKPVKAGKDAWRCIKMVVIDPPRNKDSGSRPDARVKGNNTSVKFGKTKAGISNRSSSSMPR